MARLFGTDGVRGVANEEITPLMAMQLGQAGAYVLTKQTKGKATILVGKDTRISGDMLANALMAGVCSARTGNARKQRDRMLSRTQIVLFIRQSPFLYFCDIILYHLKKDNSRGIREIHLTNSKIKVNNETQEEYIKNIKNIIIHITTKILIFKHF